MDSSSSSSSVNSSPYNISKLEANHYYFGIRGIRCWGPKLVFRTSKDVFTAPSGPEQSPRLMQLLPVYNHQQLSNNDLWAIIRSKVCNPLKCNNLQTDICSEVVELLDQQNIQHSSIDLVRFSWVEENQDNEKSQDDKTEAVPYGTVVTTPITIWVGVLPNTLTSKVAFHSSNDILNLLKEHSIFDIDVAYRESVARGFSSPELFAPVSDFNPLKAIIDPVTTTLGLPIAGLNTLECQGTMGFFFRVGKALYAVTARHVLFPEDEGNMSYSYAGMFFSLRR